MMRATALRAFTSAVLLFPLPGTPTAAFQKLGFVNLKPTPSTFLWESCAKVQSTSRPFPPARQGIIAAVANAPADENALTLLDTWATKHRVSVDYVATENDGIFTCRCTATSVGLEGNGEGKTKWGARLEAAHAAVLALAGTRPDGTPAAEYCYNRAMKRKLLATAFPTRASRTTAAPSPEAQRSQNPPATEASKLAGSVVSPQTGTGEGQQRAETQQDPGSSQSPPARRGRRGRTRNAVAGNRAAWARPGGGGDEKSGPARRRGPRNDGAAGKAGTERSQINIGSRVAVVRKEDQRSGKLTEGVVDRLLTNKRVHPRGIKVMLRDGTVGRVQAVLDSGE